MYFDCNRNIAIELVSSSNKVLGPGKKYYNENGGLIIMATMKKKKGASIDHDFIEKMEQSLSELKAGIVENLIAGNQDFKEIVEGMDPKDLADIASDDIDRKMIEAIGSQELKRLKLIDSALTRIKQGKYGLCVKCGKRIPQDRLEAIPYALMCIDCKSEEERRNR
jgi:RNA polymerase-binding protein DksA